MPVAVSVEEVPTFVRSGTVSKYADILNYQKALLSDPERRETEAVKYLQSDGVSVKEWGQIASALREVGKKLGVKLAVVFRERDPDTNGKMALYVKYNGDYVAMSDEQKAARKAAADANAAERALAAWNATPEAERKAYLALSAADQTQAQEYLKAVVRAERKAAREAREAAEASALEDAAAEEESEPEPETRTAPLATETPAAASTSKNGAKSRVRAGSSTK